MKLFALTFAAVLALTAAASASGASASGASASAFAPPSSASRLRGQVAGVDADAARAERAVVAMLAQARATIARDRSANRRLADAVPDCRAVAGAYQKLDRACPSSVTGSVTDGGTTFTTLVLSFNSEENIGLDTPGALDYLGPANSEMPARGGGETPTTYPDLVFLTRQEARTAAWGSDKQDPGVSSFDAHYGDIYVAINHAAYSGWQHKATDGTLWVRKALLKTHTFLPATLASQTDDCTHWFTHSSKGTVYVGVGIVSRRTGKPVGFAQFLGSHMPKTGGQKNGWGVNGSNGLEAVGGGMSRNLCMGRSMQRAFTYAQYFKKHFPSVATYWAGDLNYRVKNFGKGYDYAGAAGKDDQMVDLKAAFAGTSGKGYMPIPSPSGLSTGYWGKVGEAEIAFAPTCPRQHTAMIAAGVAAVDAHNAAGGAQVRIPADLPGKCRDKQDGKYAPADSANAPFCYEDAEKTTPSWCDRVLWVEDATSTVTTTKYTDFDVAGAMALSDHVGVMLESSVTFLANK